MTTLCVRRELKRVYLFLSSEKCVSSAYYKQIIFRSLIVCINIKINIFKCLEYQRNKCIFRILKSKPY